MLRQITIFYSSPILAVLKYIFKYRQVGLLVYMIYLIQTSALATRMSNCRAVVLFIYLFTFLVSVVVGIVYKDLHELLITDHPFKTVMGTTRWGYPLKFLNQTPLPSKIHKKRNSRGWNYKVVNFSKPCRQIVSHMNQWSFPCCIR